MKRTAFTLAMLLVADCALACPSRDFRFRKIADTETEVPGGTGTFEDFGGFSVGPSVSEGNVAFDAEGSSGQQGIYLHSAESGELQVVADKSYPIPGGAGTFSEFGSPSIKGSELAFRGFGSDDQQGVYSFVDGQLDLVADRSLGNQPLSSCNPPCPGQICCACGCCVDSVSQCDSIITIIIFSMFYSFDTIDRLAFCARDNDDQVRVYRQGNDGIHAVASENTPIPGGVGNFVDFPPFVDTDDEKIAFVGIGPADPIVGPQMGIYSDIDSVPGDLSVIADTNTAVPGGAGLFSDFAALSLDGNDIAFKALDFGSKQGIYTYFGESPNFIDVVANTETQIPGGIGTFSGFGYGLFTGPSLSRESVAFIGFGQGNDQGIYTDLDGSLRKVIASGDVLDGRTVDSLLMSPDALDGEDIVVHLFFDDGSQGIYLATFLPATVEIPALSRTGITLFVLILAAAGVVRVTRARRLQGSRTRRRYG